MSLPLSNSFSFEMTLEQMIREAAQPAGGGTLDGEQLQSYLFAFNVIQQDMINRGYPLSLLLQATLNICDGCAEYALNQRIYDIHNAVVREANDTTDVRLERISLAEFNELPTKSTEGRPTTYTVERRHNEIALRIWPTPDQNYTLFMYVFTKPDDLRKYTDTVRMSPRIYPALIAGLTHQIALRRSLPLDQIQYFERQYEKLLKAAYHEDRERTSLIVRPHLNTRMR